MKLSVLIVDYDRPRHLQACLRALALQTYQADEIVVVDDGSPAASQAAIRDTVAASALPVQLVRRERLTYCPAAARNAAIQHASHDYLLFLDCDILALPGLIAQHRENAAPGTFLIGHCGLLDTAGSQLFLDNNDWGATAIQDAWAKADTRALTRADRLFRRYAGLRLLGLSPRHKPKLMSGHFSLHTADVRRINGFDEHFTGWGYEDDDIGMRLYKGGCRSRSLITQARALHLWHPSMAPSASIRRRDRPNRAYFRRRHVPAFCGNGLQKTPVTTVR